MEHPGETVAVMEGFDEAMNHLESVVRARNLDDLQSALEPFQLQAQFFRPFSSQYLDFMSFLLHVIGGILLEELQFEMQVINQCELFPTESIYLLNEALNSKNISGMLKELKTLHLEVQSWGACLYLKELRRLQACLPGNISRSLLDQVFPSINILLALNEALARDPEELWEHLINERSRIVGARPLLKVKYFDALRSLSELRGDCFLSQIDVQNP
ncbi:Ras GTPaseactivatinglike protein IQGAP1like [Caligus rogercresseyi]|uniref:Ras GTPaseactivatinglike protein IQGAP1like n=1 Tax=Caligus rogercresseyi TaxID=217165 RepID=A0A7T8K8T0_CALRO|nr:Ras GTPaseactivatinglike protein IQGAP1like [Caligus rogercresseyi]